jgi:hypothetical protein
METGQSDTTAVGVGSPAAPCPYSSMGEPCSYKAATEVRFLVGVQRRRGITGGSRHKSNEPAIALRRLSLYVFQTGRGCETTCVVTAAVTGRLSIARTACFVRFTGSATPTSSALPASRAWQVKLLGGSTPQGEMSGSSPDPATVSDPEASGAGLWRQ